MLLARICTILVFIALFIRSSYGASIQDVNALKARLMDGYNRDTNPVPYGDHVELNVTIAVLAIGNLDERLEKLTTIIAMVSEWQDKSMVWNGSEAGVQDISMDMERVWIPDFIVYNEHQDISYGKEEKRNLPVRYLSDGKATLVQLVTAETCCSLNTLKYPFDRHSCSVDLHVNKWDVDVRSTLKDVVLDLFQPDGSWDVLNATVEDHQRMISIKLTFKRKPGSILVSLILPMALLALLSPLVFLLPNQSGERIGFAITTLLAIAVFMTVISDLCPQKSDPTPAILTILFVSYVMTAIDVAIVIINARVYRLPEKVRIHPVLVRLLGITERICCCFKRRNTTMREINVEEKESLDGEDHKVVRDHRNVTWKDVGWAIDMVFMTLLYAIELVLIVMYIAVLMSEEKEPLACNKQVIVF